MESLRQWLEPDYVNLADMLVAFNEHVCNYLQVERPYLRSSQIEYDAGARRSQRLFNLLQALHSERYYATSGAVAYMLEDKVFPRPDMEVLFQNFCPRPYPQISSPSFVPYLSALDALFNVSPYTFLTDTARGTSQWASWEQATQQFR